MELFRGREKEGKRKEKEKKNDRKRERKREKNREGGKERNERGVPVLCETLPSMDFQLILLLWRCQGKP